MKNRGHDFEREKRVSTGSQRVYRKEREGRKSVFTL